MTSNVIYSLIKKGRTNELLVLGIEATEELINGLKSRSPKIVRFCTEVLARMSETWRAFDEIIKRFNEDPRIREGCVNVFNLIKNPHVLTSLIAKLPGSFNSDREKIISPLAELGKANETVFQRLLKELSNNMSSEVRISCAAALREIKDPRAAKTILAKLKTEEDRHVAGAFAETLAELGKTDDAIFQKLLIGLSSGNWLVKGGCAQALGLIHNSQALEALIKGLRYTDDVGDRRSFVRRNCAAALGEIIKFNDILKFKKKLKHELIEELISNLDPDRYLVRSESASVLLLIEKSETIAKVSPNLKKRLVGVLLEELKNEDSDLVDSCDSLLGEMAKKEEILFQALLDGLQNSSVDKIRITCAMALGFAQDPRALNILLIHLKDDDYDVRYRCSEALEIIHDPKGILFKRIIYDLNKDLIKEIGLEKTLQIIQEYLELIKDYCPQERLKKIQLELIIFYREVAAEINATKQKMDFWLPARLKPPRNNNEMRRALGRVVL